MGYALKPNAQRGDALKLYASKGLWPMTVCLKDKDGLQMVDKGRKAND